MSIPSSPIQAARTSPTGRLILGALLLAALALAILAIDTQRAQADVVVTALNFISNPSFETAGSGGVPNNWFDSGSTLTSKDKRVCNQSQAGNCSFKFKADSSTKWIVQCKPYTGTNAGNQFKFKIWTKSKSLGLGGGSVAVYVQFFNAGIYVNGDAILLPGGTTPWTLRQLTLTSAADYDEVCVWLQTNSANSGTIWFDKLSWVYLGGP